MPGLKVLAFHPPSLLTSENLSCTTFPRLIPTTNATASSMTPQWISGDSLSQHYRGPRGSTLASSVEWIHPTSIYLLCQWHHFLWRGFIIVQKGNTCISIIKIPRWNAYRRLHRFYCLLIGRWEQFKILSWITHSNISGVRMSTLSLRRAADVVYWGGRPKWRDSAPDNPLWGCARGALSTVGLVLLRPLVLS